jgi:hypothetical protein
MVGKESGVEVVTRRHCWSLPTHQEVAALAMLSTGRGHCQGVSALHAAASDDVGGVGQGRPQAVEFARFVAAQERVQQVVTDDCKCGRTVLHRVYLEHANAQENPELGI